MAEKPCWLSSPVGSEKGDAIWLDEDENGGGYRATAGAEKLCCEAISGDGAGGRMSARMSISCCGDEKSWGKN